MADEISSDVVSWLNAFAVELGVPAPTAEDIDALLGLAAVAAHASARQAAPIACWLSARAGVDPAAARAVAERVAP
ncbi:MAG: DUF6457 domain-containing protein [Acidimicrobiales bacterium]|jgi:hypothetical protein|nr:DUF6457 domain-containing protein [Acidimicrobiales bacterium]